MRKLNKLASYLVIALLAVLLLTAFTVVPVFADESLREYLNTGGDGNSANITGVQWTVMYFTADDISHSVTYFRLSLKRVGNPGTVTVSLVRFDTGDNTTETDLASATYNGDVLGTSYNWIPFDIDDISLSNEYTYAIVVRAVAGDASNYVLWQKDSGGGLANAVGYHSDDSGITWISDTPADYLFEVYGDDLIDIHSVAVFTGFRDDDDLLLTVHYTNRYVPYYPLQDPSSYFAIRLYSANGNTLIASSPISSWGYKPASIYLSAASAANLILGAAYQVKLVNIFDSDVSTTYQLVPADWKGANLVTLDNWIRYTALALEDYYDTNLLNAVIGKGMVLSDEGGVIFEEAIPGLMQYRPDLFATKADTIATDEIIPPDTFSPSKDWETNLGPDLVDLATSAGDLVGLSSKAAALTAVMILFLILALVFLGKGQFAIAAIAATPIVLAAMELGILAAVYVGVVVMLLVIVFVWNVWWSKT